MRGQDWVHYTTLAYDIVYHINVRGVASTSCILCSWARAYWDIEPAIGGMTNNTGGGALEHLPLIAKAPEDGGLNSVGMGHHLTINFDYLLPCNCCLLLMLGRWRRLDLRLTGQKPKEHEGPNARRFFGSRGPRGRSRRPRGNHDNKIAPPATFANEGGAVGSPEVEAHQWEMACGGLTKLAP